MQQGSFFDKLRARRSVLERTRPRPDLPRTVLYLEWLPATAQRRVLDDGGQERVLDDRVLESNYKMVTGSRAETLIARHWSSGAAGAGAKPAAGTAARPASAPAPEAPQQAEAKEAPAKEAPAKKATKATAKKAPAKKAPAKKAPAKKAPAKKTAKAAKKR